jgi:DNA primase
MDVIALSEAGFGAAVAPLGTAVTEDQLRLMWRIADEPLIALDGDAAGSARGLAGGRSGPAGS